MTAHTFACSDTPGVFECPACTAWAHYERDDRRYCIHPDDRQTPSFFVETWQDVRVAGAHPASEVVA